MSEYYNPNRIALNIARTVLAISQEVIDDTGLEVDEALEIWQEL